MSGWTLRFALCTVALTVGCSSAGVSATPTPTTSAAPIITRTAAPLVPGTLFTITASDPEMVDFFADRGALVVRSSQRGPAPYLSKILRASPPSGPWRVIFQNDAAFMLATAVSGRIAFVESRQEIMSGGAHDGTFMLVDLDTGASTKIDHYALSAKTFRGGGGGPRGPGPAIALGSDRVAWTRVNELADGKTEGELRVARLDAIGSPVTIGRSREWIQPVSIDTRWLVYIVGGTERDDLRIRDLASGSERSLAQMLAPTQSSGRGVAARSGAWIGWIDNPPMRGEPDAKPDSPTAAIFRAVNVESGELREKTLTAAYCNGQFSGNASYFAWSCSDGLRTTTKVFDTDAWVERDLLEPTTTGGAALPIAVDGGFMWSERASGARRMTLFTLAR